MQSFEKYHPIMSRHYNLDWLTNFKLKDVLTMRHMRDIAIAQDRPIDNEITESAHFVNRAMALVMSNRGLLYGIGTRGQDDLLATFGIYGFSTDRRCATVRMASPANADPAVLAEVLPRMIGFAVHELGLARMVADQIVRPADWDLYLANHFVEQADGRLELHATSVVDLPKYQN